MTSVTLNKVEFWYGSSRNERYESDLNARVETALTEKFKERFLGIDGGSAFGGDGDTPNTSDNIPMILAESQDEIEAAAALVMAIVQRPIEIRFAEEE